MSSPLGSSRLRDQATGTQWRSFIIIALFVAVASSLIIFPRTKETSFFGDESDWVSGGYYYTGLLVEGDFRWEKWACDECGPWGRINMHLGKWLTGLPLLVDPVTRARPYMVRYDFDKSEAENRSHGRVPDRDILARARTASATFGVFCCVLVFAIGFWAYNIYVGVLAAALLLSNSLFLMLASQAMADSFYNFFLLSGCLTVVFLLKTSNSRRAVWLAGLCGLLAGLGCSVKITGILLASAIFLLAILFRFIERRASKRDLLVMVAVYAMASMGIVYLLNPFFWPSWSKYQTRQTIQEAGTFSRQIFMQHQLPRGHDDISALGKKYPQLRNLANVLEFPALFLRWDHSMSRQLDRANWHGSRFTSIPRALVSLGAPGQATDADGTSVNAAGLLYTVFAVMGVVIVSMRLVNHRHAMNDQLRGSIVPLIYLVVNYGLIVTFLKLNWNRYYMPTFIALDFFAAYGIYGAFRFGYQRARQQFSTDSSNASALSSQVTE